MAFGNQRALQRAVRQAVATARPALGTIATDVRATGGGAMTHAVRQQAASRRDASSGGGTSVTIRGGIQVYEAEDGDVAADEIVDGINARLPR